MPRTYKKSFDWERAKALRDIGLPYEQIAAAFGVSISAVWLACHPDAYQRGTERARERQRTGGTCQDCGTTISRNYAHPAKRCRACWGKSRTKAKQAGYDGWNDATGSTAGQREMLEGSSFEVRTEW
jgi:hypothetical protein